MTRSGRLVLLAAVVLYLAGAANASQPAYTFASALIGVLLATYVLSRLAASGLRIVAVRFPPRVIAGQPATAVVEVANAALIPKPRARVAFSLISESFQAAAQKVAVRVPALRRGARAAIEVEFTVPWRGLWTAADVRLEGSDPLGLFLRPEPAHYHCRLLATPAHWQDLPLPWEKLLAPGTRARMSAERTDTGEYRTVRDYVPGDDVRHVHWQASAHRSKLQVKVYDRRREIQAHIWLAPVPAAEGQSVDEGAELAISVAATLAHAFAMAPLPTVLRADGLPAARQGPGSGEVFWRDLLGLLAELPYVSPQSLRPLAMQWSRALQVGGTVYLVSNTPEALEALAGAVPGFCWPVAILTGRDAPDLPGRLVIRDYDQIPEALSRLVHARTWAEAVVSGA